MDADAAESNARQRISRTDRVDAGLADGSAHRDGINAASGDNGDHIAVAAPKNHAATAPMQLGENNSSSSSSNCKTGSSSNYEDDEDDDDYDAWDVPKSKPVLTAPFASHQTYQAQQQPAQYPQQIQSEQHGQVNSDNKMVYDNANAAAQKEESLFGSLWSTGVTRDRTSSSASSAGGDTESNTAGAWGSLGSWSSTLVSRASQIGTAVTRAASGGIETVYSALDPQYVPQLTTHQEQPQLQTQSPPQPQPQPQRKPEQQQQEENEQVGQHELPERENNVLADLRRTTGAATESVLSTIDKTFDFASNILGTAVTMGYQTVKEETSKITQRVGQINTENARQRAAAAASTVKSKLQGFSKFAETAMISDYEKQTSTAYQQDFQPQQQQLPHTQLQQRAQPQHQAQSQQTLLFQPQEQNQQQQQSLGQEDNCEKNVASTVYQNQQKQESAHPSRVVALSPVKTSFNTTDEKGRNLGHEKKDLSMALPPSQLPLPLTPAAEMSPKSSGSSSPAGVVADFATYFSDCGGTVLAESLEAIESDTMIKVSCSEQVKDERYKEFEAEVPESEDIQAFVESMENATEPYPDLQSLGDFVAKNLMECLLCLGDLEANATEYSASLQEEITPSSAKQDNVVCRVARLTQKFCEKMLRLCETRLLDIAQVSESIDLPRDANLIFDLIKVYLKIVFSVTRATDKIVPSHAVDDAFEAAAGQIHDAALAYFALLRLHAIRAIAKDIQIR